MADPYENHPVRLARDSGARDMRRIKELEQSIAQREADARYPYAVKIQELERQIADLERHRDNLSSDLNTALEELGKK